MTARQHTTSKSVSHSFSNVNTIRAGPASSGSLSSGLTHIHDEVSWGQPLPRRRPHPVARQLPLVTELHPEFTFEHMATNWDDGDSLADTDSTDTSFIKNEVEKPCMYILPRDYKRMGYEAANNVDEMELERKFQKEGDQDRQNKNWALKGIDSILITDPILLASEAEEGRAQGSSKHGFYPGDSTTNSFVDSNRSTGTVIYRENVEHTNSLPGRSTTERSHGSLSTDFRDCPVPAEHLCLSNSMPLPASSTLPRAVDKTDELYNLPMTKSTSISLSASRNGEIDQARFVVPSTRPSAANVSRPVAWSSLSTMSTFSQGSMDKLKARWNLPIAPTSIKQSQQEGKAWGDLSSLGSSLGSVKQLRDKWERVENAFIPKHHMGRSVSVPANDQDNPFRYTSQASLRLASFRSMNAYKPPSPVKCSITHSLPKPSPHTREKSNVTANNSFFPQASAQAGVEVVECVHPKFQLLYDSVRKVNDDYTALGIAKSDMEEQNLDAMATFQALVNNVVRLQTEVDEVDGEIRQAEFELHLYGYQAPEEEEAVAEEDPAEEAGSACSEESFPRPLYPYPTSADFAEEEQAEECAADWTSGSSPRPLPGSSREV